MNALALAVFLAWTAQAEPAKLGRPATLEARLENAPPDALIRLDLQASTTDVFVISKADDLGGGRFRIEILPLAVGRLSVPLVWDVETKAGKSRMTSPPLEIDVAQPALDRNAQILDIKAPQAARPALWPWFLAAALGAAAWLIYRRRRGKRRIFLSNAAPADLRPAEVIAQADLDALASSGLWQEGRFREYYFRLTEILRWYLERRYVLPATRLTTAELLRDMRRGGIDKPLVQITRQIFERADLVKFAKAVPQSEWGAKDLEAGRGLVHLTTPSKPAAQQEVAT